MDCGHVHCLLVAKRSGEVILERFYDRLSDADKGELRAALHNASAAVVQHAPEDAEFVDGYRCAFSGLRGCPLPLPASFPPLPGPAARRQ